MDTSNKGRFVKWLLFVVIVVVTVVMFLAIADSMTRVDHDTLAQWNKSNTLDDLLNSSQTLTGSVLSKNIDNGTYSVELSWNMHVKWFTCSKGQYDSLTVGRTVYLGQGHISPDKSGCCGSVILVSVVPVAAVAVVWWRRRKA